MVNIPKRNLVYCIKPNFTFWFPLKKRNSFYLVVFMDRNVDLGEGGAWDRELLRWVDSCNIACGGHAGSPELLLQVMQWAFEEGVHIGAHPSYPDREHFGRRSLSLSKANLQRALFSQLRLFQNSLDMVGAAWHHVKPHGALYNDLANNSELGEQVIEVLQNLSFSGIVYALAGSPWVKQLQKAGFSVWEEGFVDRRYIDSGALLSRSQPAAVLTTTEAIVAQYESLCKGEAVTDTGQTLIRHCQTVCLHSDTPQALQHAQVLAQMALR